jgi:hypothetical protein
MNKNEVDVNFDDDFGFSLVSEDELKSNDNKLEEVRALIMPLLKNLMANPEKDYIYWPNRTEKIKQFIRRLDDCINQ